MMTAAFGHKFTRTYGMEDTGVWFDALCDLPLNALKKGFKKMLYDVEQVKPGQDVWPPNVKELRSYCMAHIAEFGLPSTTSAFKQVCDAKYLATMYVDHPAVYYAAILVGYEKLTQIEAESFFPEYQRVYELLSTAIINGLSLPFGAAFTWGAKANKFALNIITTETIQKAILDLAQRLTIRNSHHV